MGGAEINKVSPRCISKTLPEQLKRGIPSSALHWSQFVPNMSTTSEDRKLYIIIIIIISPRDGPIKLCKASSYSPPQPPLPPPPSPPSHYVTDGSLCVAVARSGSTKPSKSSSRSPAHPPIHFINGHVTMCCTTGMRWCFWCPKDGSTKPCKASSRSHPHRLTHQFIDTSLCVAVWH